MNRKLNIYKLMAPILASLLVFMWVPVAHAAPVSSISDTLSRLKISTTADHTIVFTTPSGIDSGDTVTLTFPSTSFTMGASLTGVTIGGNAVTSASWAAPTLTITASATSIVAPAGTATIVIPSAQITNPSSANTYVVTIAGTFGDTGSFAIAIVSDEQIPVTATVSPSITFSVVNTAFDLGDLSPSSVATSALNNISVGTNATSGYTITVQDVGGSGAANPGLYSTGAANLIASSTATLSAGTEGYGGQCAVTAGSGTCDFSLTSAGEAVTGFSDNSWSTFAHYNTKPSGTDTYQIRIKAAISASTTAGYYQDTLTLVATGNF